MVAAVEVVVAAAEPALTPRGEVPTSLLPRLGFVALQPESQLGRW